MFKTEDCLLITEKETIPFSSPIRQAIEINDIIIVCLEWSEQGDDTNNVYGVKNGQIIWRVQDKLLYNPSYAASYTPQWTLYGLIGPLEDNNTLFWGTAIYGDCFRIDSATGEIVGYEGFFK